MKQRGQTHRQSRSESVTISTRWCLGSACHVRRPLTPGCYYRCVPGTQTVLDIGTGPFPSSAGVNPREAHRRSTETDPLACHNGTTFQAIVNSNGDLSPFHDELAELHRLHQGRAGLRHLQLHGYDGTSGIPVGQGSALAVRQRWQPCGNQPLSRVWPASDREASPKPTTTPGAAWWARWRASADGPDICAGARPRCPAPGELAAQPGHVPRRRFHRLLHRPLPLGRQPLQHSSLCRDSLHTRRTAPGSATRPRNGSSHPRIVPARGGAVGLVSPCGAGRWPGPLTAGLTVR